MADKMSTLPYNLSALRVWEQENNGGQDVHAPLSVNISVIRGENSHVLIPFSSVFSSILVRPFRAIPLL